MGLGVTCAVLRMPTWMPQGRGVEIITVTLCIHMYNMEMVCMGKSGALANENLTMLVGRP